MKKREITRIAAKLGWEFGGTAEAVKELLQKESIIEDWKEFFKICVEAENPEERWSRVHDYIDSQLREKDLVKTICEWLYYPDPCFSVCALFNVADDRNLNGRSYAHWTVYKLLKRFSATVKYWPLPFFNPVFDPVSMCDFLFTRSMWELSDNDRHSIFHKVIEEVGFMAFNITAFRVMATDFSTDPTKRILAKDLTLALKKRLTNTNDTQKKYWLYYVLVEKLKEECGLVRAFEEVGKRVAEGNLKRMVYPETIHRRYFERKKIAKKKGLSIDEITSEFGLGVHLEKYLTPKNDVSGFVSN